MTRSTISLVSTEKENADTLGSAFEKINAMFAELYDLFMPSSGGLSLADLRAAVDKLTLLVSELTPKDARRMVSIVEQLNESILKSATASNLNVDRVGAALETLRGEVNVKNIRFEDSLATLISSVSALQKLVKKQAVAIADLQGSLTGVEARVSTQEVTTVSLTSSTTALQEKDRAHEETLSTLISRSK